jgi:KipI family sensor histidine kinase inhibitor
MKVELVNENSVIVYFSDIVTPDTAETIAHASHILRDGLADCMLDIVPSYTSVLLSCNPSKTGLRAFTARIHELLSQSEQASSLTVKRQQIVLPIYYGEEVALDHAEISVHLGLPFSEVVKLHSAESYRVFAIGFAPGFAYLGNTHPAISIPRKENPRAKVPKGSVAIADRQTAVYPSRSPGGWQVIGRTPLDLFDIAKDTLSLFEMGDEVRFQSIERHTFLEMGGQLSDV